jgi:alkaline phosphatase
LICKNLKVQNNLFLILLIKSFLLNSQDQIPPNIIFLIGDGMGLSQITAGLYSNNNKTALEEFEYIGLSKTHAIDNLLTDSAAAGTAMACGVKTYNGVIGLDYNKTSHPSILEICSNLGFSSGLVVTSSITHATPACFYAKVSSRNEHEEIARQLSLSSVDVFVGGGRKYFNNRKDQKNLIEEMNKYSFVSNLDEFKKSQSQKIAFLTYDDEPPKLSEGRSPSLKDLSKTAIDKLSINSNPFFLMIEGSQIDWGGHDNDIEYFINEFQEFNETIKVALEFAKKNGNTLVLVTADHETGGFGILGGSLKNSNVKGDFLTKGHSSSMVPVFSFGKKAHKFSGIYDNTEIFDKLYSIVNP